MFDTVSRWAIASLLFAFTAGNTISPDVTFIDSAPADTTLASAPGVVSGIALDTRGAPIVGATIWIRPAVTAGLLTATTDDNGRYSVQAGFRIPYRAYAWTKITYAGKRLCLRLGSPKSADYDSFVPGTPVVRNFTLQASGEIGSTGAHFGADLRLFVPGTPSGARLMVTMEPTGPLVDGSTGKSLTFDAAEYNLLFEGIPVGVYKTSAAFVAADGARTPLDVSSTGSGVFTSSTTVQWQTKGSCVGSTGAGPDRAYLWIRVPGSE